MILSEEQIKKQLKKGRKSVLKYLFELHYEGLCRYANKIIQKHEIAEEIVQDVFIYLWEKRKSINIESSVKNYILKAVKNKSINYLNSKYARISFQNTIEDKETLSDCYTNQQVDYQDLYGITTKAIESLPERCALIFKLSRNYEMTYREIAEQLDISIKTVESQMTIALKRIREYLDKHWYK